MVFTAIRLYYIYGMDFTDPTYSTIVPTTIGSVQMGIAIMVASSPLLRPIFDRTIASWFGLSVASGNRPSQKGSGYIADSSHRYAAPCYSFTPCSQNSDLNANRS